MDESNYCLLCQEQHTTTARCTECKSCGKKGHGKEVCPLGLKRQQESQEKNSTQVSKASKSNPLNDSDIVIKDISGSSVKSCNEDIDNVKVSVKEENMNISDDDNEETQRNNNNVSTYDNDDSTGKTVINEKRGDSGEKKSTVMKNTSEKHWKLYESKKGKLRVLCPWCIVNVDLKNFHKHIARVHIKKGKEILETSLLCPTCNTAVLPSKVFAHITSCLSSVPNRKLASSTLDLPRNTSQSKLIPKPPLKASQSQPSHGQQKSTLNSSRDTNNIVATGNQASQVFSAGFSQSIIDNHNITERESASLNDKCASLTYDLRSKLQKAANPEESSVSETFIEKLDLFLKEMRQQSK